MCLTEGEPGAQALRSSAPHPTAIPRNCQQSATFVHPGSYPDVVTQASEWLIVAGGCDPKPENETASALKSAVRMWSFERKAEGVHHAEKRRSEERRVGKECRSRWSP